MKVEKNIDIIKEVNKPLERKEVAPVVEILGSISELSRQKYGGADANPRAWHQ